MIVKKFGFPAKDKRPWVQLNSTLLYAIYNREKLESLFIHYPIRGYGIEMSSREWYEFFKREPTCFTFMKKLNEEETLELMVELL